MTAVYEPVIGAFWTLVGEHAVQYAIGVVEQEPEQEPAWSFDAFAVVVLVASVEVLGAKVVVHMEPLYLG